MCGQCQFRLIRPHSCRSVSAGRQPAVQYLAGELKVEAGEVLPVLATHNTVRLRFDVEAAEYLHLAKPDAAFPAAHFAMLADVHRNDVSATLSCAHMQPPVGGG